MAAATPSLDVIVLTHNRLDLTMRCFDALYRNTHAPFHLIVVDDSTDLTPLYMTQFCKEHDNITYIHSDTPYKTGNEIFCIGFEHCKTDFMATVMNSIRVEPEWEIGALQAMGDPKVAVVGLKCLFPTGYIESAGITMNKYLPCDMGRDLAGHRLALTYECEATQWAFAVVRVSAFKGLLEPYVFNGFRGWDDIDNCFVAKKAGYKIMFCGASVGYHEPRSTRGDNSPEAAKENRENGERFYKRWGFWDAFVKDNGEQGEIHTPPKAV